MNALADFDVNAAPHGIVVRDRRFNRAVGPAHRWAGGDPIATAWYTALSATFPRGEALFVDAVKAFREGAPPRLEAEIRSFIKQEVNHSREHLAFNRASAAAGYDLTAIDKWVEGMIGKVRQRPPHVWLAVTIALEHFTAMFAHEFLKHPQHFAGSDGEQAEMWRWHAVEELEHKGVAYDTWLHATRGWSRWQRWRMKALAMLIISRRFVKHRFLHATWLLAQDGIEGWRAKVRLAWYLVGKPGILRRIFPAWCAYFLPGFHPWDRDDRALIGKYDSEYAAANLA